ncbi:MAG TPA: molybdate ABC transporter permease subunit [Hyphomicrobiaceae bacterium]|nr:molybdate ABC transporter permease subunit [Hyphomicrobiaceae bacterium]
MDWTAFRLSLSLALWTALLIVPTGVVIGRALARRRGTGKAIIEALLLLPLVLPPTVLGYGLLMALAPSSGFGRLIASLAGGPLVFTFTGILIASLIVNIPFAVQPIVRAFESLPQSLGEAAAVSGLSPLQTFWRIELPLVWPGIVTAIALVVAHTLGEFGVILMIGGSIPGETQTLSIALYDRVQAFRNAEAAVIAGVLVITSLVALALVNWTARRTDPRRGRP